MFFVWLVKFYLIFHYNLYTYFNQKPLKDVNILLQSTHFTHKIILFLSQTSNFGKVNFMIWKLTVKWKFKGDIVRIVYECKCFLSQLTQTFHAFPLSRVPENNFYFIVIVVLKSIYACTHSLTQTHTQLFNSLSSCLTHTLYHLLWSFLLLLANTRRYCI